MPAGYANKNIMQGVCKSMKTERDAWSANGLLTTLLIILLLYLMTLSMLETEFIFASLFIVIIIILLAGLTIVKPNEARVVLLFGKYLGTVRREGLIYTVPFTKRKRMSLKINTFQSDFSIQLHNETVAVQLIIFYKIVDTAKVLFEVEQFEQFVQLQCETTLKTLLIEQTQEQVIERIVTSDELKQLFMTELEQKLTKFGIDITELHIVNERIREGIHVNL